MSENELEKNLKEVKNLKVKLDSFIRKINHYQEKGITMSIFHRNDYRDLVISRDNISEELNYYQNQVLIEQNKEIINYLKEQKK